MKSNITKQFGEKTIWALTVALLASFSIFDESSWISIILAGITLLILLIDAAQSHGIIKLSIESFHKYVLVFCLFCYVSALWAWQPNLAIEKGATVFEILICMSVVYAHYSKQNDVSALVEAVMWANYVVVAYAISFYGLDTILSVMIGGGRLSSGFTNINSIGMVAAIAVTITVHKILFVDHKLVWSNIFVLPAIVITGMSGSRKAILLVVIGVTLLLLKKFGSKNTINTIFRWAIIVGILYFGFRFIMSLPAFEAVSNRMKNLTAMLTGVGQVDSSVLLRRRYIELGLEQFTRTPILGIGMNNARLIISSSSIGRDTYLHNNYVELLADGGVIGFLSYYSIYFFIITQLWKHRKSKDPYLVISAVLTVLFLVMDYGGVSYYSKSRYLYFLVFFLEIKHLTEIRGSEKSESISEKSKTIYYR